MTSPQKETLKFADSQVDAYYMDSFVYFRVQGMFDDENAMEISRYVEQNITERPGFAFRVWDLTELSSKGYKMTPEGTSRLADWFSKMKKKYPGTRSWFIAPDPLVFGFARMYELQSSDEDGEVIVFRDRGGLPEDMREKINHLFSPA